MDMGLHVDGASQLINLVDVLLQTQYTQLFLSLLGAHPAFGWIRLSESPEEGKKQPNVYVGMSCFFFFSAKMHQVCLGLKAPKPVCLPASHLHLSLSLSLNPYMWPCDF